MLFLLPQVEPDVVEGTPNEPGWGQLRYSLALGPVHHGEYHSAGRGAA